MKLVFGAVVTDGAGKTGGQVASHNKGGAYLRTKVSPINKQSSQQSRSRSVLGSLSKAWAELSPAQQLAWSSAALNYTGKKSGGAKGASTGKAMYVGCNARLSVASFALISSPVVPSSSNRIKSLVWSTAAHTLFRLNVTLYTFTAGIAYLVYGTPPLSSGTSFIRYLWKFTGAYTPAGVTDNLTVGIGWNSVFGTSAAGMRIAMKVVMIDKASGIVLQEEISPFVVLT